MKIITLVSMLSLFTTHTFANEQTDKNYLSMYQKCLSENGGASSGSVEACADNISEKTKKEINKEYNRIHKALLKENQQHADQFDDAQKSWLTYRNAHCELATWYVGSPQHSYCPMIINIERLRELKEFQF